MVLKSLKKADPPGIFCLIILQPEQPLNMFFLPSDHRCENVLTYEKRPLVAELKLKMS